METEDSSLWSRVRAGDDDAFALLFERHAKAIYNYCFRRTGSWDTAEDLLSIVFLEAWRRRDQELPAGKVLPWLYGVATNVVRNQHRLERRFRAALARMPAAPPEPDFEGDSDARLDDESRMKPALDLLAQLPRRDQEVFVLCAPTRNGGFCSTVGCDRDRRTPFYSTMVIAGPTSRNSQPSPGSSHVHVFFEGDTLMHGAARLAIRFEDGNSERTPLVWVSRPIDAGFFVYELPKAHWKIGKRPAALAVEYAHGKELAQSTQGRPLLEGRTGQGLRPTACSRPQAPLDRPGGGSRAPRRRARHGVPRAWLGKARVRTAPRSGADETSSVPPWASIERAMNRPSPGRAVGSCSSRRSNFLKISR